MTAQQTILLEWVLKRPLEAQCLQLQDQPHQDFLKEVWQLDIEWCDWVYHWLAMNLINVLIFGLLTGCCHCNQRRILQLWYHCQRSKRFKLTLKRCLTSQPLVHDFGNLEMQSWGSKYGCIVTHHIHFNSEVLKLDVTLQFFRLSKSLYYFTPSKRFRRVKELHFIKKRWIWLCHFPIY